MLPLPLIDTHTHFDVPEFDHDRLVLAKLARQCGVQALVLIGFLAERFDTLVQVQQQINQAAEHPQALLAPGLHPFYIDQHTTEHLLQLEQLLKSQQVVAIGEIGLDTFTKDMKQAKVFARQQKFFSAQLELAHQYNLPVLLHIRRAHAETLNILKKHRFKQGGIAHAFGGGIQEAKAFIQMGFKLGVTGQVTNPNAKRLHQVIETVGADHLVLETDCPDMTPLCCQQSHEHRTRNTPANLPFVLDSLASYLQQEKQALARQIWQNTCDALNLDWSYPHVTAI
ncbi:TatD family hydrolase [Alkanindiges illinoisensis]|uniref:TatD family deoxyribonuclease n=1 Tax=Alkanindiges illinoisensis TaxID=197183 RepID=A0A4Y7XGB0_9GAMM|nr:TatD family hydrolase [Alkanindiges illinoisensis]TEU30288.1 TatD family deoxyribonuclease [Alkanindiges illinoisensis]